MTSAPHPDKFNDRQVARHFDSLADSYDELKRRNGYYYSCLKALIAEAIPPGRRVLDIGTGTGEILNNLRPSKGVGLDLSRLLIERAREKFPSLEFHAGSFEDFSPAETFDAILLADVIEHLTAPEKLSGHLRRFSAPGTQIVLTMANPAWEPVLELGARLGLKMDEGPHHRISEKQLLALAEADGFALSSRRGFVLLPIRVPLLSDWINDGPARLGFLQPLCLIRRYVFVQR